MPSPIGHLAFWPLIWRRGAPPAADRTRRRLWAAAVAIALLAPDFDVALAIVYQTRISDVHNGPSHSLAAALIFAALFAALCTLLLRVRFLPAAGVLLAAYLSHLLLDIFTWGRGIELFWPLTHARIQSPLPIFMGVRHSVGAPLWMHLLTALNDLAFCAVVWLLWRAVRKARGAAGDQARIPSHPSEPTSGPT